MSALKLTAIGTSTGLPGALVTMFSVAASAPTASGVKMTAIVQLFPAPRLAGQKTWSLNWDTSPVMAVNVMGPISTGSTPWFSRVNTCFARWPNPTLPKLRLVGDTLTPAVATLKTTPHPVFPWQKVPLKSPPYPVVP